MSPCWDIPTDRHKDKRVLNHKLIKKSICNLCIHALMHIGIEYYFSKLNITNYGKINCHIYVVIYIFILELVAKEKAAPSNNTNNRIIT